MGGQIIIIVDNVKKVIEDLSRLIGRDKVSNDPAVLALHNRDAAYLYGDSKIVVYPKTTDDIRKVVRYCYRNDIKIYPQGGSSELTGSSIAWEDGIIMSFIKMNRLLEYSPLDRYVVVEPGLRLVELNMVLEKDGYFFPIDPASVKSATVGGAINTGAGGLRGFRYGTMKDWVLGLEIVLPDEDATLLKIGSKTFKSREGYDLTRLIVGSEGTLAIVSKAVLKIMRKPGDIISIAAFFRDLHSLMKTVLNLLESGLDIVIMEFVDANTVEMVKNHKNISIGGSGHMLIIGCLARDSNREDIVNEIVRRIVVNGGENVLHAYNMEEAENRGIYSIRRGFYTTLIERASRETSNPILYIEDISVPPSRLPEVIKEIEEIIEAYGIPTGLAGHIGDGNLHPTMYITDPRDSEKLKRMGEEIMMVALKYDGVISSEHGIGLMKKNMLEKAFKYRASEKALELMYGIKKIFDPKNILNPGKVLP